MSITGFRDRIRDLSPALLKDGVGEREMYCFGLALDLITEKRTQALDACRPPYAQLDALLVTANDRGIFPGITEGQSSIARRTQTAFETYQLAGIARAPLSQILGYVLNKTPEVREMGTRFDPTTYPPTRLDSTWNTYPEGRSLTAEPVFNYCPAGGAGDWNWDTLSPIEGSWGWWSSYVAVYSVGAQAWISADPGWGYGSTYSGSGYYSTVSGGAYAASGSYTGSAEAWGYGSTYVAASSGYYSTVSAASYAGAGLYVGTADAWGVDASTGVGIGIQTILRTFKAGDVWIRTWMVVFDATLFDPAGTSGVENPDGYWGQWSKVSGGAYVASRSSSAVYGGEIVD